MAPANLRSPASAAALMLYAKKYAARQPVSADISFREKMPTTPEELCELEAAHQVLCHKPQTIYFCSESSLLLYFSHAGQEFLVFSPCPGT